MFDRMVVGWDGRAAASAALDWALRQVPPGGVVELVHVEDELDVDPAALPPATLHERARLWAEAARAGSLHPGLRVRGVFTTGDAESVLARRCGDDGLLVLGSPSPQVGRHATLPTRIAGRADRSLALVPVDRRAGPVVVGVGPTTGCEVALLAADFAARARSDLVLLRAGGFAGPVRASAAELTDRVHEAHPDVPVRVVMTSRSAVGALEQAGEEGSLLIVGPRLTGSGTRETLVGRVRCPLLLLRPGDAGLPSRRSAAGDAVLA